MFGLLVAPFLRPCHIEDCLAKIQKTIKNELLESLEYISSPLRRGVLSGNLDQREMRVLRNYRY
jgi:hypothetical protein